MRNGYWNSSYRYSCRRSWPSHRLTRRDLFPTQGVRPCWTVWLLISATSPGCQGTRNPISSDISSNRSKYGKGISDPSPYVVGRCMPPSFPTYGDSSALLSRARPYTPAKPLKNVGLFSLVTRRIAGSLCSTWRAPFGRHSASASIVDARVAATFACWVSRSSSGCISKPYESLKTVS